MNNTECRCTINIVLNIPRWIAKPLFKSSRD